MLATRGLPALRAAKLLANTSKVNSKQAVRNGHGPWNYRCAPPPPPKFIEHIATGVQGFAWWWILWHLVTEPGHVFGEFPYPEPSKWTDEELGIPK